MCSKCDGSGKIPLRRKADNTIVPFAWVYCEKCHKEDRADLYHLKPTDIDYPVSWDFHRFNCAEHGWPDPGSNYPDTRQSVSQPYSGTEKGKPVVEHIVRHSDLSQQEYRKLREMEGQIKYLQGKLLARQTGTNTKSPTSGNNYKDISI